VNGERHGKKEARQSTKHFPQMGTCYEAQHSQETQTGEILMEQEMDCPVCGKPMSKRNYYRAFDKAQAIYQWMCSGFPRCNKRVYVDAQNQVVAKPRGRVKK
jgi:ribosomal protein L37AE/L43A